VAELAPIAAGAEQLGLLELRDALRSGQLSAREALAATLRRADAIEHLHPFLCRLDEDAQRAAAASDARIANGTARSMEGVPITVKDVIWMRGTRSPDGSLARESYVAPESSPPVQRLIDAGCIVIAKTANPEYCWSPTTYSAINGVTRNPWDPERTSGGSSGGAAVATACGVGVVGLGTDAGGSIRNPAALCGLVGFKPSYGAVADIPRATAYWSLSTIGPLARTVADAAIVTAAIVEPDPVDRLSVALAQPATRDDIDMRGRRLLICEDFDGEFEVDASVRAAFRRAVARMADAGAEIVDEPIELRSGLELWYRIGRAEIAAYSAEWGDDRSLLSPAVQAALLEADAVEPSDYALAQRERNEYARRFHERLVETRVDAIVTPTLEVEAWSAELHFPERINDVEYSEDATAHPLMAANLAGCPALTIPCGFGGAGLPVGLQLVGPRMSDWRLLSLGAAVERALDSR
jgi:Asp-tRNA(Asn)/Glu-tRNA(Gln) amidotransferase A subunit family amidase